MAKGLPMAVDRNQVDQEIQCTNQPTNQLYTVESSLCRSPTPTKQKIPCPD